MSIDIKAIIKKICPPLIIGFFKRKSKFGFFGNYKKWQDAKIQVKGYDSPIILEKVKNSLLKVKQGLAVYERDSVIFDKKQYSWPILTALLWIASKNKNQLNVLDFGGSLGSSYFQNKDFLEHLDKLEWNIVEQNNFVKCGKENFEDNLLKFYYTIGECLNKTKPQVFFASSVIQYLEEPYNFLKRLLDYGFEYIIFDRTTFLANTDRLTIQKVRPGVYNASYPAWFLNEKKFLEIFKAKYNLIADFDSLWGQIDLGDTMAYEKGYIFAKK
jgi:putative methyltransferase (TIGR04325 family)